MAEKGRFPRKIVCRHDCEITVKPLRPKDIPDLIILHQALPKNDRSLLQDDLDDPYYEQRVKRQIKDEYVYRLVAWHEEQIVSSMVMIRNRAKWLQHTAEFRTVTHPDYRNYGIATRLMEESLPFANSVGIEKLYLSLLPSQTAAIRMAKKLGFTRAATLKDHIKDSYGLYHDVRIYSVDLEAAHKQMEQMIADYQEYSG